MAIELAYRLATDNSPAVRKILDQVILLLVPTVNPDGQISVTDFYNKYLGTPQEGAAPPWLYHTYAGHDDNRDMFNLSLKESQLTAQVLWHDWFPSVWLDQHQQGPAGPRMFTMPSGDPINPNVSPLIYRWNSIFGQTQAAALEAAGKDGIMHTSTYTSFWEGALAWSGWWHNQVGLLTEAASVQIATPIQQMRAELAQPPIPGLPRAVEFSLPLPLDPQASAPNTGSRTAFQIAPPRDVTPRANYPRPWLGGSWTLRDIVDYELISSMALLESAADSRETLLRQIYDVNAGTIEAGRQGRIGFGDRDPSYAILIPIAGQQDPNEVIELVDKLRMGGVEVFRARQAFSQNGESWPAGTYVIPFTQVFARYAKDLLEVQAYPAGQREISSNASDGPYDVSAWSLGKQFGVRTVFAHEPLPPNLGLDQLLTKQNYTLAVERSGSNLRFPYNGAHSAVVVNRLLKAGVRLTMISPRGPGDAVIQLPAATQNQAQVWSAATSRQRFDVAIKSTTTAAEYWHSSCGFRVWAYISPGPPTSTRAGPGSYSISTNFRTPLCTTTMWWPVICAPALTRLFYRTRRPRASWRARTVSSVPADYRGGLGDKGWLALKEFSDQGGTLIAFGDACNLLVDKLPLPVKELKRGILPDQHDGPGTILNLQVDTASPLGWGMAPAAFGFYLNSPFFDVSEGFGAQKARVVARYPNVSVAASGYLKGEEYMLGRAAVVSVEMNPGKVVLFGIRPQHRAQTHATLPMIFNALYWSAEGDLAPPATQ